MPAPLRRTLQDLIAHTMVGTAATGYTMLILALLLTAQIAPQSADLPNRQPQLATDGTRLALAYGAGDSVFFAASKDAGKSWSTPVVVSSRGKLSLGMRRGPRIATAPGAIVISAVVGEKGRGADGDLIAWRSVDGGKSWSAGKAINDVSSAAREGLHTMAADGKGIVFAAWLDLRGKGTRLYGSTSNDGGATWSPNALVYESPSGSVCECCHPTAAVDAHGRIFVMFRNSIDGNRDMYLVRSDDGGRTFGPSAKLGVGTWKLNACPMDGGGLQVGADGKPLTIWRREGEVFLSAGPNLEQRIGAGRHPILATTPRGPALAWTEGKQLKVVAPGQKDALTFESDAAYPSMVTLSSGAVVLAWEQGGAIVIRGLD